VKNLRNIGNMKTVRKIREKSRNFAKFSGKLKFLTLRSLIYVHAEKCLIESIGILIENEQSRILIKSTRSGYLN